MKNLGIWGVFLFFLSGCQLTAPEKYTGNSTNSNICTFNDIKGKTYRVSPWYKDYVKNTFFYDPKPGMFKQNDKTKYRSLIEQSFKILETGVVTVGDTANRASYLSEYRYSDAIIAGVIYKVDRTYSTKVVTEDCSIYYLEGGQSPHALKLDIVNNDSSKLNEADIPYFFAKQALQARNMEAKVKFDKFTQSVKISTPEYEGAFIRGLVNKKTNTISYIQLYVDAVFSGNWGFLKHALDADGNHHHVTKISTDADCSYSHLGCKLTETVGVALTKEFLENNKNGFEIKVFGTSSIIVKVPKQVVLSFLEAINSNLKKM